MTITSRPPLFGKAELRVGNKEQHPPAALLRHAQTNFTRESRAPYETELTWTQGAGWNEEDVSLTEDDKRILQQEYNANFADQLERQSRLAEVQAAAVQLPYGMMLTASLIPGTNQHWGPQSYKMVVTRDGEEIMPPMPLADRSDLVWKKAIQDVHMFLYNKKPAGGLLTRAKALLGLGNTDSANGAR
jgi:hypothetical protein